MKTVDEPRWLVLRRKHGGGLQQLDSTFSRQDALDMARLYAAKDSDHGDVVCVVLVMNSISVRFENHPIEQSYT